MSDFDKIRDLIIEYEEKDTMTKGKLLDKICKVCFDKKINKKNKEKVSGSICG